MPTELKNKFRKRKYLIFWYGMIMGFIFVFAFIIYPRLLFVINFSKI